MVVRKKLVLLCAVALVCSVVSPQQVDAGSCPRTYIAKRGDSWWAIARKSETTLNRILKLNGAKTSTKILIGGKVCVPALTAPAPATPATPKYTQAQVIQIIRDAWPDNLEERALFIAHRESKYQPRVINRSKCCYGLFQIYYRWHKSWLPEVGVTSANQLLDPLLNAAAAYRMYQRNNGWGPWK